LVMRLACWLVLIGSVSAENLVQPRLASGCTRSSGGGCFTRRRPSPPLLVSVGGSGGWQAAGSVAGIAVASEVVQIVNTCIALLILRKLTGEGTVAGLVEVFADFFSTMGWASYPAYAALLLSVTILPVMSAILFIILAGTLFGVVRGTIVVSLSLSTAAAISAMISRSIARAHNYGLASIDPRAAAVDASIASRPSSTSLLLITLLRLSPVLPFTFSNYLAGLTSLPLHIIFVGTLLGTLPTQAVYVGAGALGRQALQGGVRLPPAVVGLGVLATAAAIVLIGRVAQQTLEDMHLEEAAEVGKKGRRKPSNQP